ncbi:Histone-lysine N-methyltransferase SUVR5 [Hordeum vulgare]|nr:Histone-lysine N-methyltransferase SUVR5 [Hordeum vulgare]
MQATPAMPDYLDTQESETINIDAREKDGEHIRVVDRNRKHTCFMEEELTVFSSMTRAVKEVVIALKESKTVDVHPDLYVAVMEQGYNYNNHRGFKIRQAREDAYSKYVREQACSKVEIGTMDRPFELKNFIIFVQFIAITVL